MTSVPSSRRKTFLDFFPAPKFLMLSTAGVAITDESVAFVELKRTLFGEGFKLESSAIKDFPEGAVKSGTIKKPEELASILQKLSSEHGIRYVNAALPEEKAYLFTAMIDQVPREGLDDAVAFIVEENAPVSLAESVFDFEVIGKDPATGKLAVSVAVVPKDIVSSYVSLFESAGITPISFDIESRAVARAVIRSGDRHATLIINSSGKKTGLYVVEDGVAQFSTTIPHSFGEDSSYADLDELRNNVSKVVDFWNGRAAASGRPEKQIEKTILCGSRAGSPEFVEKLMSESGIKYELANAWSNAFSKRHFPKMSPEESLGYIAAVGLVLSRGRG